MDEMGEGGVSLEAMYQARVITKATEHGFEWRARLAWGGGRRRWVREDGKEGGGRGGCSRRRGEEMDRTLPRLHNSCGVRLALPLNHPREV